MGGNLLGLLEDAGIDWYPMLRTNKVNPHPLQFGVYEDLVYHHGGGFRLTAGGRLWRASVEDRLNATLRGRLAARLPRKGLGRPDPKDDRPRAPLPQTLCATSWPQVNEQVFDLIQRDDEFYLQLIEPERGGELTTIKAPVLLEDAKQPRLRAERLALSGRAAGRGGQGGEDAQAVLGPREGIDRVLRDAASAPSRSRASFTIPAMSRADPFGFWPGA